MPADTLARARAAIKRPVTYTLGLPGRVIPKGATTAPLPAECDCSGFVAYCENRERFVKTESGNIWFDTWFIHYDASRPGEWFEACPPELGCLIVWPDRRVSGRKREGHIGIVSEVIDGKVSKVIHCAASHPKGRAVQETGPEVFTKNGAICCRWREA